MNLNEKILGLEAVTGYPVEPDLYEGNGDKYISFTYEDERPVLNADNRPVADIAYLQINFFCPKNFNYFADKKKIRDYLESQKFKVTIRSWLEDAMTGDEKIRRVLFEVNYTESRK